MATELKKILSLSAVKQDEGIDLYREFLLDGERVQLVFKSIRDMVIFTSHRLITIDVQGLSGKKKEFMFINYTKINAFSTESAGTFDLDSEFKIWVSGLGGMTLTFTKGTKIFEIAKFLGKFI